MALSQVDENLVPDVGAVKGVNPKNGGGDCDGAVRKPGSIEFVQVPCSCPPDRPEFLAKLNEFVAAGNARGTKVSFPTGNSDADKIERINTALVTLQNLNGPGVGCPAASTTLLAQKKALESGVDASLVPDFGANKGINPKNGGGDCDGAVRKPGSSEFVQVPCSCPPDRPEFLAKLNEFVAAGNARGIKVSFPTGNSNADKIERINTALVTLQNLNGPGVGCPAASTTLLAQKKALESGNAPPAPNPPATDSDDAQTTDSDEAQGGVDASLVPDFGANKGINPKNGGGDCDGAVRKPGSSEFVQVPCSCPPDRPEFLAKLNEFVAAGNARGTKVSFPTGNSNADKIERINTALVTLQNLNGPGVGCPAASTTLLSQKKALESGEV
ncbi:hypothetical protein HK099_000853 [Clydaea vesicula]|uniref:Uncharacterized protein n=1 Tax=Clydaea vesicula TaxID=447962 RepID=A0AAD5U5L7_9FUNG|nr:hypothetical protein HK099_000853 [Clydaea vesicula]